MTIRQRTMTFLAALLLGLLAGWWIIPQRHGERALVLICSEDAAERGRGWDWLLDRSSSETPGPRLVRYLPRIDVALLHASDEAMLDGADVLEGAGQWTWDSRPEQLMLRELEARVRGDAADHAVAVDRLQAAPLIVQPQVLLEPVRVLLANADDATAAEAFDAVTAWLGPERVHLLDVERTPLASATLTRRYWLAQAWAAKPLAPESSPIDLDEPRQIVEAMLFHRAMTSNDDDTSWIEELTTRAEDDNAMPVAYLLKISAVTGARTILKELAEHDDPVAKLAWQSLDTERDRDVALRLAARDGEPPWRRRLALWRSKPTMPALAQAVLAMPPDDPDGSVYVAAILAERLLAAEEGRLLSERWIRSFDDAEKRAGAILAALLGAHGGLLHNAAEAATEPRTRTLLRIAAETVTPTDKGDVDAAAHSREFTWRALDAGDEDFDPDVAACLLARGERGTLARLTELPETLRTDRQWQRAVQRRAILIERFAPDWHARLGRPIGGDIHGLQLHFDALRALWNLQRRTLHWHATERIFTDLRPMRPRKRAVPEYE